MSQHVAPINEAASPAVAVAVVRLAPDRRTAAAAPCLLVADQSWFASAVLGFCLRTAEPLNRVSHCGLGLDRPSAHRAGARAVSIRIGRTTAGSVRWRHLEPIGRFDGFGLEDILEECDQAFGEFVNAVFVEGFGGGQEAAFNKSCLG